MVDFVLVREHLKTANFPAGIELHRARTLAEARQLHETAADPAGYDILLLDLSLPDSRGADTYFDHACAFAPQIAVIILSGNENRGVGDPPRSRRSFQDYLPKSDLTPDLLWRSITYAIKRQQQRVEMENLAERLRRTGEELEAAQGYLIHAEKVDSLGRLASSIAHEVKNPLGILRMGVEFMETNLAPLDGDVGQTLILMKEAVGRAECVIGDMLNFSHEESAKLIACPLNDLVERVARMLKHDGLRRGVVLRVDLATPSPLARCDRNGPRAGDNEPCRPIPCRRRRKAERSPCARSGRGLLSTPPDCEAPRRGAPAGSRPTKWR